MTGREEMLAFLEELEPCPFCGGEAAFNKVTYSEVFKDQEWGQDTFHGVNCINCGVSNIGLVGHKDQERAAEKWNKRTALAHPQNDAEAVIRFARHGAHLFETAKSLGWKDDGEESEGGVPGHTDLMVTPESIDAFMEANPLPSDPAPPDRDAIARIIGSLPTHPHDGDEQLVLHDVFPGDYESRTSKIYELTDAVFLALRGGE